MAPALQKIVGGGPDQQNQRRLPCQLEHLAGGESQEAATAAVQEGGKPHPVARQKVTARYTMTAVGNSDFSERLTAFSENSCPRRDAGFSRFRFGARRRARRPVHPAPPRPEWRPASSGSRPARLRENDEIVAP